MQFENYLLADRPGRDESLTYSSHARRSMFSTTNLADMASAHGLVVLLY